MSFSTDDCKTLLAKDNPLIAAGALDPKGWKRLSKRNASDGVERIFSHPPSGMFARVLEANGALSVTARGSSLDSVCAPAASAPAPVPAKAAPSPFWPAISPRFVDVAKAARLVQRHVGAYRGDDEDHDALMERIDKLDPVALANQFTFAVCQTPDEDLMAAITPTCYWKEDECCFDQESPIGRLLPSGSDDINGCGTWVIPGFSEPAALALHLLSLGFVWDAEFQDLMDDEDNPTLPDLAPLIDGRALTASASRGAPSSAGSRL